MLKNSRTNRRKFKKGSLLSPFYSAIRQPIIKFLILMAVVLAVGFFYQNRLLIFAQLSTSAYFFPPRFLQEKKQVTKIIFAGDLMFDRYIRQMALKQGNDFLFQDLSQTLLDSDLVLVNLEGPITDYPSVSIYSQIGSPANYLFTMDPSVAQTLKKYHISLVNLGNNHIFNFGEKGLAQTKQYLNEAGIDYFGYLGEQDSNCQPNLVAPTNQQDCSALEVKSFIIKDINGLRLAFLNYNQFITGSQAEIHKQLASLCSRASQPNCQPTNQNVFGATEKQIVDFIIVYTHWGNEYQTQANQTTQTLAHQLIDQGADLIIGSHPHVIQNHEIYQGKHIYYSLGNFIFDQYFSPATKKGRLVEVTFSKINQPTDYIHISTPDDYQIEVKEKTISISINEPIKLIDQ